MKKIHVIIYVTFATFCIFFSIPGCKSSKLSHNKPLKVDYNYEKFKKTFEEEMAKSGAIRDSALQKNDSNYRSKKNDSIIFLLSDYKSSELETTKLLKVDYNYEKFKRTFEEEMNKLGAESDSALKKKTWIDTEKELINYFSDKNDKSSVVRIKCTLPSWFSESIQESADTMYMIGISDPGYEDSIALSQAISRATALNALSRGDSLYFSNDFHLKSGMNKSEMFTNLNDYSFIAFISDSTENSKLIKFARLPSKEIIVLMGFPIVNLHDTIPLNSRVKLTYSNKEGAAEHDKHINLQKTIFETQKYQQKAVLIDGSLVCLNKGKFIGNGFFFPHNLCSYDHYKFYYQMHEGNRTTPLKDFHGTDCKQTLWVAYLNQIVKNLTRMADSARCNLNIQIKSTTVTDVYGNPANGKPGGNDSITSKKMVPNAANLGKETLTRKSMTLSLPWKIYRIFLDKNNMKVDLR